MYKNTFKTQCACPANYDLAAGRPNKYYYKGDAVATEFIYAHKKCPAGTELASFEDINDFNQLKNLVANEREKNTEKYASLNE